VYLEARIGWVGLLKEKVFSQKIPLQPNHLVKVPARDGTFDLIDMNIQRRDRMLTDIQQRLANIP
jgi:hypothetical protein